MGFDSWDMYNVGDRSLYPGPIDNSGLFSGNLLKKHLLDIKRSAFFSAYSNHFVFPHKDQETQALKEHLIDELDYVLVPTEAWNKLVSWYSCLDGQRPIVRKVMFKDLFIFFYLDYSFMDRGS